MGLADELLEDPRHLAAKGEAEKRPSCMRRPISTAYYAVFHLIVEDFVGSWPFADQRTRLARMFNHKQMSGATFAPKDKAAPTAAERSLVDIVKAFEQLQKDRNRADYDLAWNIVPTDVTGTITLAEEVFAKWRSIRTEDIARHHLLSMFGANRKD